MLERLDHLLRIRLRARPAIIGWVFLAVLVLSLALFLLLGDRTVSRVLFFPGLGGRRIVAEERMLPRHGSFEQDIVEVAEGVLLGPARSDALRLFPRGGRVNAVFVSGRTLIVDLSALVLAGDAEVPLRGQAALDVLARSLRFNFPRFREVDFYIDGQVPRFPVAAGT